LYTRGHSISTICSSEYPIVNSIRIFGGGKPINPSPIKALGKTYDTIAIATIKRGCSDDPIRAGKLASSIVEKSARMNVSFASTSRQASDSHTVYTWSGGIYKIAAIAIG